jgi:hypothetical protein
METINNYTESLEVHYMHFFTKSEELQSIKDYNLSNQNDVITVKGKITPETTEVIINFDNNDLINYKFIDNEGIEDTIITSKVNGNNLQLKQSDFNKFLNGQDTLTCSILNLYSHLTSIQND